eukprot:m.29211 g.29211  ORF g.29211 m.29211 type:complete len:65 (+) comp8076_c0_seq1:3170-3364(+)
MLVRKANNIKELVFYPSSQVPHGELSLDEGLLSGVTETIQFSFVQQLFFIFDAFSVSGFPVWSG